MNQHASDTITVTLPAAAESVALARRLADQQCRHSEAAINDDTLDDIAVITSELVTNAIQHGQPDIVFGIHIDPVAVTITVLDHGPYLPKPLTPTEADEHVTSGRGLGIINHLANDWGITHTSDGHGGKTVWATITYTSRTQPEQQPGPAPDV